MLQNNTPNGRTALSETEDALTSLGKKIGVDHVFLPKLGSHPFDGFVSMDNNIVGLFEAKSRDASYRHPGLIKYKGVEYETYLITERKIEQGAKYSKEFGVPFFILVYLRGSGHVLSIQVTDQYGHVIIDYEKASTRTQATINGGIARRANAFIKIEGQVKVFIA